MRLFAYVFLGVLALQPLTADPAWAVRKIEVITTEFSNFSDKTLTSRDVEAALLKCSGKRGWKLQKASPGMMVGRIIVRGKHYVEVDIVYNSKAMSVTYKDSRNMRYNAKQETSHNRYKGWVTTMSNEVALCLT